MSSVDRSTELLSVARTALYIAQQQQQDAESTGSEDPSTTELSTLQASDLALHDPNNHANIHSHNTAKELLSEAVLTLNHLDETLKKLSKLVKRRGHTNDPTNVINLSMCDFQSFVKDIMEIINTTLPQAAALPLSIDNTNRVSSSSQRKKHYENTAKILKKSVEVRMEEFKEVMKVRGDVIKDLTIRWERLLKGNNANVNKNPILGGGGNQPPNNGFRNNTMNGGIRMGAAATAPLKQKPSAMEPAKVKSQLNSPLFTMSSSKISNPYAKPSSGRYNPTGQNRTNVNPYSRKPMSTTSVSKANGKYGSSGGYGGGSTSAGGYGYNGAGYGGYNNSVLRHRGGNMNTTSSNHSKSNSNNTYNPYQMEEEIKVHDKNQDENIQTQIQKRRQARQTQNRLDSARMAEKSLAELTSMFGKMSSLIQSQGETLEKIEDDVEIAMGYVDDGYEEVGKLYEWTQGNRGLIIKCFAILIFVVIFMRYYG